MVSGRRHASGSEAFEDSCKIWVSSHFTVRISGTRPVEEAVITSGGISVKEIVPATMGSRLVNGLFFAGEIIDTDAYTGGFNLQIAWATGRAAGKAAAEYCGRTDI